MIYTREKLNEKIHFFKDETFSNRTKIDQQYMLMLKKILFEGVYASNRTGIPTWNLVGEKLEHDLKNGFPLVTVKKVMYKAMATELEGFIKGITDKRWYQERGCNIWNQWKNPKSNDENDLGKFYAHQYRCFNDDPIKGDQLKIAIDNLIDKKGSNNRRLVISAWNPLQLDCTALHSCHFAYQLLEIDETLNIIWYQRSCDMLAFPTFNLSSYALLLSLICKITGHTPGKVVGFGASVHIYENHIDPIIDKLFPQAIKNELNITTLPKLIIKESFTDLFNFDAAKDIEIIDYKHDAFVKMEVAI